MAGDTSERQFSFDEMVRNIDGETVSRIRAGTVTQKERDESTWLNRVCTFWENQVREGKEVGVEYSADPRGVVHMRV